MSKTNIWYCTQKKLCQNKNFDVLQKEICWRQKQVDVAQKSVLCQQKKVDVAPKKYCMSTKARWYCAKNILC